jgi:hypothetical protein
LFAAVLKALKECVRQNRYVVTFHAEEEMDNDELSIFDVERVIMGGEIIERQQDKQLPEWKYLVRGQDLHGADVIVVVKMGVSGKMAVITVFRDG